MRKSLFSSCWRRRHAARRGHARRIAAIAARRAPTQTSAADSEQRDSAPSEPRAEPSASQRVRTRWRVERAERAASERASGAERTAMPAGADRSSRRRPRPIDRARRSRSNRSSVPSRDRDRRSAPVQRAAAIDAMARRRRRRSAPIGRRRSRNRDGPADGAGRRRPSRRLRRCRDRSSTWRPDRRRPPLDRAIGATTIATTGATIATATRSLFRLGRYYDPFG